MNYLVKYSNDATGLTISTPSQSYFVKRDKPVTKKWGTIKDGVRIENNQNQFVRLVYLKDFAEQQKLGFEEIKQLKKEIFDYVWKNGVISEFDI